MIEIKDLLVRFNNILLTEKIKIESVRNVLRRVVGIEIKNEDIKIKNGTIYLNIKPIYKNEIFLNKEEINFALEEVLGKKAPNDIR